MLLAPEFAVTVTAVRERDREMGRKMETNREWCGKRGMERWVRVKNGC